MSDNNINISTQPTVNNSEDCKEFTIRKIPADVHKIWKIMSYQLSTTMEVFALDAIREKVGREVSKQQEIISKRVEERRNETLETGSTQKS
jgi:hypothetical protein